MPQWLSLGGDECSGWGDCVRSAILAIFGGLTFLTTTGESKTFPPNHHVCRQPNQLNKSFHRRGVKFSNLPPELTTACSRPRTTAKRQIVLVLAWSLEFLVSRSLVVFRWRYCCGFFLSSPCLLFPPLSKNLLLTSLFSSRATSADGQVFTTTLSFTTTIEPGSVVTAPSNASNRTSSGSHTGAIVGGAVGGIAVLIILAALVFFCLRKRRKDEFDGNFDPAHVSSVKGGGGTLPHIDLGEDGIMGNGGGARVGGEVDEDDGMGGRLASGVNGGGIIVPYAFKPATPVGGGGGGQQYRDQEHPQMQQMANVGGVGASGYGNEKRGMRQYSPTPNSNTPGYPQQIYATPLPPTHTQNQSISSGSYYPTTLASSTNPNPNYYQNQHPNQHLNPNGVTPEPYTPGAFSVTSDGSSSVGGGVGGIYYHHPQSMGRGPSPGPSVLSSSSGNGARNAKEAEAMGRVIMNPDDGLGGGQGQQGQQQYGQNPAFQAYLQNGPAPHQHQYHPSSSSSQQYQNPQHQYQTSQPLQDQTPARPGTAVVVHEDGGRVVLRKGEESEREVLSPEIPPTYDSLPVEVRRDG
ncbi:hypothetical protein BYT27DRAFT_6734866 [Phlegmacium glaucopus]|nr:hypothetical protein BYT27DRAFT_6734866 [Phlegmacium glaucopus]